MATTNLPDRYRANLPVPLEGNRLPGMPVNHAETDRLDLGGLYAIFRRRLWLFLMVVGLCLLVAINITMLTPKMYAGHADVMINKDRTELVPDDKAGDQGKSAQLHSEDVDTETKVIQSQELAECVVDQTRLTEDKAFVDQVLNGGFGNKLKSVFGIYPEKPADLRAALADALLRNLDATRLDTAFAIRIAYTDRDPARAARVANAFAESYAGSAAARKRAENEKALAVLSSRIEDLRKQAQVDFKAVQDFRVANNLLSQQATALAEQEASAYSAQLAAARAQAAADRGHANAAAGTAEAAVVNSPGMQALRGQRATLSVKVADLSSRYLETHPDLITARQQLAEIDAQIANEMSRTRAGITAGLNSNATATAQQAGSLQGNLSSARGTLAANNRALVRLDDLNRKAQASQDLYESYLSRYKEVLAKTGIERAEARVLSPAEVPGRPSSPLVILNLALGLIVGVLLGTAAAIATESAFRGLTTADDVENRLGMRYLGGIPQLASVGLGNGSPPDSLAEHPGSAYAEAVRGLLGATRQGNRERNQVIAVSSSLPDEGKTSLALSLARSAALAGESVIIIDCDIVQRGLSSLVGADSGKPGLREMMRDGIKLGDAMVKDSVSDAMVLPITAPFHEGERLLERGNFHRMIGALREHFGVIILDTAPILPIAETREIVLLADNVIITALWRKTSDSAIRAALRLLPLQTIGDIGVTLNVMDMRKQAKFGGGDATYYYNSYKKYYAAA
jgi:uncharacterized protein involved in exopolysaccharide biosynthesis/Mrp family chromosome partitioning ATPase